MIIRVRRIAIERMGWQQYVARAGLTLVAETADPGNPNAVLRLYDLPAEHFDGVRLLVMRNGSPDRSGTDRYYGEAVPGHLDDPIAAVAWQYGVTPQEYLALQRRT